MATVIDNKDFEKNAVVFCDCGSELLQFFKETPSMTAEPYFGFIYYNSFVGKQKMRTTYFEFADKEEVEKLCNILVNAEHEDYVCILREYHAAVITYSNTGECAYIAIVRVNPKNGKLNKKCEFEICLTKEKAKKLATTLSGWIKNNI